MAVHHVELPEQVVTPGEELWVKIIDIDLQRRRISLSIKQAAEGGEVAEEYREAFGEHAYDEQGNYIGSTTDASSLPRPRRRRPGPTCSSPPTHILRARRANPLSEDAVTTASESPEISNGAAPEPEAAVTASSESGADPAGEAPSAESSRFPPPGGSR